MKFQTTKPFDEDYALGSGLHSCTYDLRLTTCGSDGDWGTRQKLKA
jgi:hypothetical protein